MRGEDVGRLRRIVELLDRVPVTDPHHDEERRDLVQEIAGHVLPRLEYPNAPLLVAVAGSSGSGKSHVVNALTGRLYSRESPLRPTTRHPILLGRPESGEWQEWRRRLRALAPDAESREDDSEVTANAVLADLPADGRDVSVRRVLAIADLALILTTPARYADAATWDVMTARLGAGQPVWVVINRANGADDEVGDDMKRRLREAGHDVPVFLLPEGDGPLIDVLRARLVDATGPGRSDMVDSAVATRVDRVFERVAALTDELEELRVRGERLKRLADAEYLTASRALSELIVESGLGSGAAAAKWSEVAERLAGVVTRRVGVAAERTATAWHTLDDGNRFLAGPGHELWRHPPETAHIARDQLLGWEQDVAVIVNRRAKRNLKPRRLGQMVAVVKSLALGGSPKVTWRINRRLRDGVAPAAEEARMRLAELAAGIVAADEHRFLDRMGQRPSADAVAALRESVASRNGDQAPRAVMRTTHPPAPEVTEEAVADA